MNLFHWISSSGVESIIQRINSSLFKKWSKEYIFSLLNKDELLDLENKILTITDNSIYIKEKKRIFEDYFGYLKISINKIEFNFEIRIQIKDGNIINAHPINF